jgi:drug/metabolite transporter (DMT)-like permease
VRPVSSASVGLICALVSAVGFSIKSIFIKSAYRYGVDPETLLAMRMLYSLPFFVAMAVFAARREPRAFTLRDWRELAVLGFFGYYAASYADFLSLKFISAALARLVLFSYPAIVVMLTAVLQRRRPSNHILGALVLSYAGVAFAVIHDQHTQNPNLSLGVLLAFASAVSFAIYLMLCGPTLQRLGATRVTAWATGIACMAILIQFAVLRPLASLPAQPWPVHGYAIAMALFSTVLPIWLSTQALRRIGASRTAIVSSAGPVVTMFLAWAVLGESVGISMLAGAALVILGVRLVARQPVVNS